MIISPARFEDEVNKIYGKSAESGHYSMVDRDIFELMLNTLDSMGYGAGVHKILEEETT